VLTCAGASGSVRTIRTAHCGPELEKSAGGADQLYPERARLPSFGPRHFLGTSPPCQIDSNMRALHVDHVAIVGVVHGGLLCRCWEKDQCRGAPSFFCSASSDKVSFNSSCPGQSPSCLVSPKTPRQLRRHVARRRSRRAWGILPRKTHGLRRHNPGAGDAASRQRLFSSLGKTSHLLSYRQYRGWGLRRLADLRLGVDGGWGGASHNRASSPLLSAESLLSSPIGNNTSPEHQLKLG